MNQIRFLVSLSTCHVIALALFCALQTARAQNDSDVKISVLKTALVNGFVRYSYVVDNKSGHDVVAFRAGYDYYSGVPELSAAPAGWTFDQGLPVTNSVAPANWEVYVVTTEESPYWHVVWRATNSSSALASGAALVGFQMTVTAANASYESSHWTVILGDATARSAVFTPAVDGPSLDYAAATPVLNRQNGLYEQAVTVTNIGSATASGGRVVINTSNPGVEVFNASGTNSSGAAFLQWASTLPPLSSPTFALMRLDGCATEP